MAGNKTHEIYWEMINVPKLPQYMQRKQIYFKNPTPPNRVHSSFFFPTKMVIVKVGSYFSKNSCKAHSKITHLKELKYARVCLKINILFSSSTQQSAGKKCW